jgi:hypothetical protein
MKKHWLIFGRRRPDSLHYCGEATRNFFSYGTGGIGPGIMPPTMGITPPTPPDWLQSIMQVFADGIAH